MQTHPKQAMFHNTWNAMSFTGSFLSVDAMHATRIIHASMPSYGYLVMYAHVIRNLMKPGAQFVTNASGTLILILGYAVAFLGYAMVFGDMGFWAAKVIFDLFSMLPTVQESLFGDFGLGYPSISLMFALHYLTGLLFAVCMFFHVFVLHTAGSHHAVDIKKSVAFIDTLAKDTGVAAAATLFITLIYVHNSLLVHGENDVYPVNFGKTPPHIVPESYLLSVYGALKCVPNKIAGIITALVFLTISIY